MRTDAGHMAEDLMPAVLVGNEVEREALRTMYAMRGYGYTAETNFLGLGRSGLVDVRESLGEAMALAESGGGDAFISCVVIESGRVGAAEVRGPGGRDRGGDGATG